MLLLGYVPTWTNYGLNIFCKEGRNFLVQALLLGFTEGLFY